jgi:HK97 family phage major capsid protein
MNWYGNCTGPVDCANGNGFIQPKLLNEKSPNLLNVFNPDTDILFNISTIVKVQGGEPTIVMPLENIGDLGWVQEQDERDGNHKTPMLNKIKISMFETYAQPQISWTLYNTDTTLSKERLRQFLIDNIDDAFLTTANGAFTDGDGTTNPQGLLTTGNGISRFATQTTSTTTYSDLVGYFQLLLDKQNNTGGRVSILISPSFFGLMANIQAITGQQIIHYSSDLNIPPRFFGVFPMYFFDYLGAGDSTNDLPMIGGDFRYFVIAESEPVNFIIDENSEKQWVTFYKSKKYGSAILDTSAFLIFKIK